MSTTGKPIPQARSPHLKGTLLLILALLAVFLLLEGDGHRTLFQAGNGLAASSGPFVQPVRNPAQVDDLHPLGKPISYNQSASLYAPPITPDEDLGQLV